jgi:hypothetical protein
MVDVSDDGDVAQVLNHDGVPIKKPGPEKAPGPVISIQV